MPLFARPGSFGGAEIDGLKIGLICCWPAMRIYTIYSASVRAALQELTGAKVAVVTTDCLCFEPEKALNKDYDYIDMRYVNRSRSTNPLKNVAKHALYPVIEKRRGTAFAECSRGYDVVDFQQSSYAFGYESLKAFLEAKTTAKRIVTIHKFDAIQKENPELNRVYNLADGVIVFSKFTKEGLVAQGVDAGKIAVIYHGTALPELQPVTRDQAILFCGSPIPNIKGFEQVAPALAMLRKDGIELKVKVYGFYVDEEKDYAIGLAKAAGVDDLLTWVSFKSEDELLSEHQKSLVCLVPYTGYAGYFPSAFSMGCGVPVVATDIMGHSEYIDGTGLLVAPGSAEELAVATKRVLTDDALRAELGSAGRVWAESSLGWDTVGEQTLAVFRAAMDGEAVASAGA
jgi:glycosyltransferase involved in cell wall biosynthesis